jgi:hypothetical protein
MSAELIYKTTTPQAIQWYLDAAERVKADRVLRDEYADRMLAEFGAADVPDYDESRRGKRALWLRNDRAFALDSGYDEKPPEGSGWRLDSKDRNWQPKLATKEGKARAAELAALTTYDLRAHFGEVGIAQMAFAEHSLHRPGLDYDEDEGVLYVIWGSGRCVEEALTAQAKVPEIVWEELPRSQWYAREERIAAANKAKEAAE